MGTVSYPGVPLSLDDAVAAAGNDGFVDVNDNTTETVTVAQALNNVTIRKDPGIPFVPIITYTGVGRIVDYYTNWTISDLVFLGSGTASAGLKRSGGGTSSGLKLVNVVVGNVVDECFDVGQDAEVDNVVAFNAARGFESSSTGITYDTCLAFNCTGATGYGFSLDQVDCVANHCIAAQCDYGFRFVAGSSAANSIALENNDAGFWIAAGALPVTSCISHGNLVDWSVNGAAQPTPDGCSTADPLFGGTPSEDPADYVPTFDPDPLLSSPAIDFCSSTVGKATDFGGNVRPVGAPDAGLWEFQDHDPPIIVHAPLGDQPVGQDVLVEATVTDDYSNVDRVVLTWRVPGSPWQGVDMVANGDLWSATIPGSDVTTLGVDYWFWAVDDSLFANEALLPANAPTTYFSFAVLTGLVDVSCEDTRQLRIRLLTPPQQYGPRKATRRTAVAIVQGTTTHLNGAPVIDAADPLSLLVPIAGPWLPSVTVDVTFDADDENDASYGTPSAASCRPIVFLPHVEGYDAGRPPRDDWATDRDTGGLIVEGGTYVHHFGEEQIRKVIERWLTGDEPWGIGVVKDQPMTPPVLARIERGCRRMLLALEGVRSATVSITRRPEHRVLEFDIRIQTPEGWRDYPGLRVEYGDRR